MIRYKDYLLNEKKYRSSSVNSYLVAANRFFQYMDWYGLCVKTVKVQRSVFVSEEKEFTKGDLKKLVEAARGLNRPRIAMIIQTISGTGMRVSEVQFLTVSAVKRGQMTVFNKGKERPVLIQRSLQLRLLAYIRKYGIQSGPVFRTKRGNVIDRSYIWREMKNLCDSARLQRSKVFPHNLRALFARTYYSMYKDLAKLADILGHSSIETTRIYIKTSGSEHRQQLDRLGLLEDLNW